MNLLSTVAAIATTGALDVAPIEGHPATGKNPHERGGRHGRKPGQPAVLCPPFKASRIEQNGVPLSAKQRRKSLSADAGEKE